MRLRGEHGQGSTEYLGMAAVAALLVGSVAFAVAGSSDQIRSSVESGICLVVTLGDGDCGDTSADGGPTEAPDRLPTYMDPSLTPEQRATLGNYAALGDSIPSGEGGSHYATGTDVDREALEQRYFEDEDRLPTAGYPFGPFTYNGPDPYSNMCHRSTGAYSQRVADTYEFSGDRFAFRACSGAVIDDFYTTKSAADPDKPWQGNDGEDAQKDYVDEHTTLITFSIGGNDADFAGTLQGCIGAGLNPFDTCSGDDEKKDTRTLIDAVGPRLTQLLKDMRQRAPNARIIVVGYPRFFAYEPDLIFDGTQIDKGDQQWINGETRHMNDVMSQAVEDAGGARRGFEFVDVNDAFEGCEIGKKNPCMRNLENGFANGKLFDNGSYHPNDKGHERLATMVEEQIRKGG